MSVILLVVVVPPACSSLYQLQQWFDCWSWEFCYWPKVAGTAGEHKVSKSALSSILVSMGGKIQESSKSSWIVWVQKRTAALWNKGFSLHQKAFNLPALKKKRLTVRKEKEWHQRIQSSVCNSWVGSTNIQCLAVERNKWVQKRTAALWNKGLPGAHVSS